MASINNTRITNKALFDTIRNLKKKSNETGLSVYRAVAKKLSAPASQRSRVNLSKLEKYTKDGENVIIGGKVLGDGILTKKITIIAFSASESAIDKINKAGSKFITIDEFLSKKNNSKLKIIG